MPGREDLIQQNRVATRARVENAGEQASVGGEKPTYSSHRSLLGGNLDVASALESIEFSIQGPLGDGALRNSVAYIRYWNRPGSKATAETASQTVDATQLDPALDPQLQTAEQLRNAWYDGGELPDNTVIEYSTSLSGEADVADWYTVSTGVERDEDGNIIKGVSQTVFSPPNKDRQTALSKEIPTTKTDTGSVNTSVVANSSQVDNGASSTTGSRGAGVGQLKPANPNGFVNTTSRIGRSVLGLPPGQTGYQGAAGSAQGGKAPLAKSGTLSKGMWQFLFNPSELEIEAGPEFKVAETWGVSDKANSGQPLNWSHNKNTQLIFNSVLLNGFVFGRKVEELEQGIFELFLARDGEGQAGPPILEFVWGKRVFGPCVIKEISIKEKMWDEGMVVNAELSFTLEQIPEWTINDGYVDIARPGKIPMVYDSTEPSGNVGAGTTAPGATSPSDTPPGGGGASPDQKPSSQAGLTSSELYRKCQRAGVYADQFWQIESQGALSNRPGVIRLRTSYNTLYPQTVNELGSSFTSLIKEPLTSPTQLYKSTELAIAAEDKKTFLKNYRTAGDFVKRAANSARIAAKTFSDSAQCKVERDRVNKVTQEQKQEASCNSKRLGSSCADAGVTEGQAVNTCSGIRLICARGYLKDPNSVTI